MLFTETHRRGGVASLLPYIVVATGTAVCSDLGDFSRTEVVITGLLKWRVAIIAVRGQTETFESRVRPFVSLSVLLLRLRASNHVLASLECLNLVFKGER